MLLRLRMKLIELLAGNEPILMNWRINSNMVKDGASVVYIPLEDDKIKYEELSLKAALTPLRNEA